MIVIGDVHGNFPQHAALCSRFPNKITVQIGDMGVGFPDGKGPYLRLMNDYFFRGNHDGPRALGEGGVRELGGTKFFFVPGAWSIDWSMRTLGRSWWPNEELSTKELDALLDLYIAEKPNLMLTHECPAEIGKLVLNRFSPPGELGEVLYKTRTGQALQAMFEAHQPAQWIFGHYHVDWTAEVKGTKFRCLNELSWMEV